MGRPSEDYLAHFGVKGMKWGKRKTSQDSSTSKKTEVESTRIKMTPDEKKAMAKKIAIGTGTLLVAAGAAYVSYKLVKSGKVKVSDLPKSKPDLDLDSLSILHSSRTKNKGFKIIKDGGFPSPLSEMDLGFGGDLNRDNFFRKYDGKIAVSLRDPEGRRDRAGRVIPHNIIIPPAMAKDINNLDDVVNKIWPLLKDDYQGRYDNDQD